MFAVTVWLVLIVCLFVVSGRFGFPVVFGLSIALLFCGLILVVIVVWVLVVLGVSVLRYVISLLVMVLLLRLVCGTFTLV